LSIAGFVGAIPGAQCCRSLGWSLRPTGSIPMKGLIMLWNSIYPGSFRTSGRFAWVSDEDYKGAGFKLLPSGGRERS